MPSYTVDSADVVTATTETQSAAGAGSAAPSSTTPILSADQQAQAALMNIQAAETTVNTVLDALNNDANTFNPSGELLRFLTAAGEPTYFYRIPKFSIEDVRPDGALGTGTHPAFVHNGGEYDALYIGAYMASMVGSEIVSQPDALPRVSRTLSEEIAECAGTTLGGIPTGAHRLASIWDRSAVNLWIAAQVAAGVAEPVGNTSHGESHAAQHIQGAGTAATRTGSMGAPANHNRENIGIADWVGNCWERINGMHLQDGEIFLPTNNDPTNIATPVSTSHWFSGSNASGNGVMSIVSDAASVVRNGTIGDDGHASYDYRAGSGGFAAIPAAPSQLLKLAGIAPFGDATDLLGAAWVRNYGRRAPLVGGGWSNGAYAGCAALNLHHAPSYRYSGLGFRPAFAI